MSASRSGTSGTPGGAEKATGSISTGKDNRAQAGGDLSTGQSPPESKRGAGNGFEPPGKCLCKRRSLRELGNQEAIPTFTQTRRRRPISSFGYISNVSTIRARVTFLNGLTGPSYEPIASHCKEANSKQAVLRDAVPTIYSAWALARRYRQARRDGTHLHNPNVQKWARAAVGWG